MSALGPIRSLRQGAVEVVGQALGELAAGHSSVPRLCFDAR
jgi:hypothetical protein